MAKKNDQTSNGFQVSHERGVVCDVFKRRRECGVSLIHQRKSHVRAPYLKLDRLLLLNAGKTAMRAGSG